MSEKISLDSSELGSEFLRPCIQKDTTFLTIPVG